MSDGSHFFPTNVGPFESLTPMICMLTMGPNAWAVPYTLVHAHAHTLVSSTLTVNELALHIFHHHHHHYHFLF